MKKRKLFLFLPILFGLLIGAMAQAHYYAPGISFQSHDPGGYLIFTTGFNASAVSWSSDLIIFSGFNMSNNYFGGLGFEIPVGVNISISAVTNTSITGSIVHTSDATTRIYCPGQGRPTRVDGVDMWGWNPTTGCIEMEIDGDGTLNIEWEIYYDPGDDYKEPTTTPPDLLLPFIIEGDIGGFIVASYSRLMGLYPFFGFILLVISVPIYNHLGLFPVSALWLMFWTGLYQIIPAVGINFVVVMLALTIGATILILFVSRRGRYSA